MKQKRGPPQHDLQVLGLAWLGPRVARGKPPTRLTRGLLGASLLTTSLLLLLALRSNEQLRPAALFLPIWAGGLCGVWRAGNPPRPLMAD